MADTIARLKITLDHVKPTVLRRIDVPFDTRSTGCIWPWSGEGSTEQVAVLATDSGDAS